MAVIGWTFVMLPAIYGSLLFCNQVYLLLREGIWVSLPAKYLFVQPIVEKEIRGATLSHHAPEVTRHRELIRGILNRVVPILQSENSWVARPSSWFGVHRVILFLLDTLSIPVVCILITYLIVKFSNIGD